MGKPEQTPNSGGPGVDISYGRGNLDRRPSRTNAVGDKGEERERERKKSVRPDQEPFEAWEREEMEKLLGELRGHLGEILLLSSHTRSSCSPSISHISNSILGRRSYRKQLPLQRQTGFCRSRFTPNFLTMTHLSQSGRHSSRSGTCSGTPALPLSSCSDSTVFLERTLSDRAHGEALVCSRN